MYGRCRPPPTLPSLWRLWRPKSRPTPDVEEDGLDPADQLSMKTAWNPKQSANGSTVNVKIVYSTWVRTLSSLCYSKTWKCGAKHSTGCQVVEDGSKAIESTGVDSLPTSEVDNHVRDAGAFIWVIIPNYLISDSLHFHGIIFFIFGIMVIHNGYFCKKICQITPNSVISKSFSF